MTDRYTPFPIPVRLTDATTDAWEPDTNNSPNQRVIMLTVFERQIAFTQPIRRLVTVTPDDGAAPYTMYTTDETVPPFHTLYTDSLVLNTQDWAEGRITLADVQTRARTLLYDALAASIAFRAAMIVHYPEFMDWYNRTFGTQVILEQTLIRTARLLSCAWRDTLRIQGAPSVLTIGNVENFDRRLIRDTLRDLDNCLETAHNIIANAPGHTPAWWLTLMGATMAILEGEKERLGKLQDAIEVRQTLRPRS